MTIQILNAIGGNMSKPIKMTMIFHDDNRIDCSLSSIQGVSPRTLNDGYRMLRKRYREMVGEERVRIEKGARQKTLDADMEKQRIAEAIDKKEDERLKKAIPGAEKRHLAATQVVTKAATEAA